MSPSATGKRYAELPGVKLRLDYIPRSLAPLVEDAKRWAIVGETGVERAIKKVSIEELESLIARAQPLKTEVWKFAHDSEGAHQTPIPDEVVLFQIYLCVLQNINSTVLLEKRRTNRIQ
jgi:hypothetical protein